MWTHTVQGALSPHTCETGTAFDCPACCAMVGEMDFSTSWVEVDGVLRQPLRGQEPDETTQ